MKISKFFEDFSSICRYRYPVICFTGYRYLPIFLDKLLKYIEEQTSETVKIVSLDQDLRVIQAKLLSTFLGKTSWYFLGNLDSLSSKKKKTDYLKFVKTYTGPHRLILFVSPDDSKLFGDGIIVCDLQNGYKKDEIRKIPLLYHGQKSEIIVYFLNKLYQQKQEYSLDQLLLLKEYSLFLGKGSQQFFDSWLNKLIISDSSLFYLSQLFFQKSIKKFWIEWQNIRLDYSDQFWTAYFSEQLFKAYFYIKFNGHVPMDQKQMLYGLPFSFLNNDFRFYKGLEFQKAHQKIYDIDLSLKNSGSSYQLDSFLMEFLNN